MSLAHESYEPAPEPDELAQWLAWAIVGAFAIWAGWAWLADGVNALSLLLAVVFGLFQVATNVLAVKVRELAQRGAWITCFAAFVFMVFTGLLTHESLDHAYAVTQAQGFTNADPKVMSWLLLVVPYLEPLLFWINKLLTEPRRKRAVAQIGLLPALWAVLFGPGVVQAHAEPVAFPPHAPTPTVKRLTKPEVISLEPARQQAKLMLKTGAKPKQVHEATGVPLSTLKRWKTEMESAA